MDWLPRSTPFVVLPVVLTVAAFLTLGRVGVPLAAGRVSVPDVRPRKRLRDWFAEGWWLYRERPWVWLAVSAAVAFPYFLFRGPATVLSLWYVFRVHDLDPAASWYALDWAAIPPEAADAVFRVPFWPSFVIPSVVAAILWSGAVVHVSEGSARHVDFLRPLLRRSAAVGMVLLIFSGLTWGWFAFAWEVGHSEALTVEGGQFVAWGMRMLGGPFLLFVFPLVIFHVRGPMAAFLINVRVVAKSWLRWVAFLCLLWMVGFSVEASLRAGAGSPWAWYGPNISGHALLPFLWAHLFVVELRILLSPLLFLTLAVAFRDVFGLSPTGDHATLPGESVGL